MTEERTWWTPQRRGEQKNLSLLGIKPRFPGRLSDLLITTRLHKSQASVLGADFTLYHPSCSWNFEVKSRFKKKKKKNWPLSYYNEETL